MKKSNFQVSQASRNLFYCSGSASVLKIEYFRALFIVLLLKVFCMIKNINQYFIKPKIHQHYSPMRMSRRNISPIRKSPIRQHYCETQRTGNLSPIRCHNGRIRSPKNKTPLQEKIIKNGPLSLCEKQEITVMEKTIKKGIGLFQQLANQKKLSSNKKVDQKLMVQTASPLQQVENLYFANFSEFSERKKESLQTKGGSCLNAEKKCNFETLLKNIKEIESVNGSQSQRKYQYTQKEKQNEKTQPKKHIRSKQYDLDFIDSFATPKQSQLIFPEQSTIRNIEEINLIEQANDNLQKPSEKEVQESYSDILSLLHKASEPVSEKGCELEDQVKISIQASSGNYFNMNPFMV